MSVVFDRRYEFVPRDRSTLGPWLIQRLRLVDFYLKKKESIVDRELQDFHLLRESVDQGHGIVVAPNHCRYADPLVMGWPARAINIHFFAMASWHLFNKSWFDSFGMRKCGAFSLHREGTDRKSLETAIETLVSAERPLIIFPEGQTFRTNDLIRPSLDGVGFIARTAARRRKKQNLGSVVVHPIGIKYVATQDVRPWVARQLDQMEKHFGWRQKTKADLRTRVLRLSDATITLNELAYFGEPRQGSIASRRDALRDYLLQMAETKLGLQAPDSDEIGSRIRTIRTSISTMFFGDDAQKLSQDQLRDLDLACEIAHQLHFFDDHTYLDAADLTEERLVETVQRIQENLLGKIRRDVPMKAVVQCGDAILVPTDKPKRGESDALLATIEDSLRAIISRHPGRPVN
jgi:1-acyl-sn-glycerol-3-phosphate acyltransferase